MIDKIIMIGGDVMKLEELLKDIDYTLVGGDIDKEILSVENDSRKNKKGNPVFLY